jgi:hypothetical protein
LLEAFARVAVPASFFPAPYLRLAVPVIAVGAIAELVSAHLDMAVFAAVATGLVIPTVGSLAGRAQAPGRWNAATGEKTREVAWPWNLSATPLAS